MCACCSCGAMSHATRDCMERPRSKGAKWTGKHIAADEKVGWPARLGTSSLAHTHASQCACMLHACMQGQRQARAACSLMMGRARLHNQVFDELYTPYKK